MLDEVVRKHVFDYAGAAGCGFEGDCALGFGCGGCGCGGVEEEGAVEEDVEVAVTC